MLFISCSVVSDSATPWNARQVFTSSWSLLKLTSTESLMPSNHLSPYCPFFSCLQPFPASRSFLMTQLFASGGPSIAASVSASLLIMNIQDWFPLGLTGLISLLSKGLSRVFSNTTVRKHQFFNAQAFLWSSSHSVHDYWENQSFYYMHLCQQVTSLLFNTLSRFFIAFLPRSKHLLISLLLSQSVVILKFKKIKSVTVYIVSSSIYHEVMEQHAMIFVFWMLRFKPAFSLLFHLHQKTF